MRITKSKINHGYNCSPSTEYKTIPAYDNQDLLLGFVCVDSQVFIDERDVDYKAMNMRESKSVDRAMEAMGL